MSAGFQREHQRAVGDFVDRGPEQVETVRIARAMVDAGQALAVMGNHEFNVVTWATPDPDDPGDFLRAHSAKNHGQHQAFLDQVGDGSALHQNMLGCFRTLPLYPDLDRLRVIHACCHPPSLDTLAGYTNEQQCILPDAWPTLCRKGFAPYDALETAVKGLEIPLPAGAEFFDKDGNVQRNIRARWWELESITYRDLAMVPADQAKPSPTIPFLETCYLSGPG